MNVIKRNGTKEKLNVDKLNKGVVRACDGLSDVDANLVVKDTISQLYDGVKTEEVDKALVMASRVLIRHEPNYAYVAARLALTSIYKEVFGKGFSENNFEDVYKKMFEKSLASLDEFGLLDKRLLDGRFDLESIKAALRPERDRLFKIAGLSTLYSRYFLHIDGRRLETPQAFWMRVAMGLSILEKDPTKWAIQFYEELSQLNYCHSTPTLFNVGTAHPQSASCFLSTVEDSIDGIFGSAIHDQSRLAKWAGGLSVDFTPLRGINALIKKTNGPSGGIIPWLKSFNTMLAGVNQGSKRKGTGVAYLETWHIEILEFLELRKETGDERRRCHDMNTANWTPGLFMERVEKDEEWTLFSPDEVPELHELFGEAFKKKYEFYERQADKDKIKIWKRLKAKDLAKKIYAALFETGHPWMTFKDASNIRYMDQHAGAVHSSNLCTEIMRHTISTKWEDGKKIEVGETAVCSLASLILSKFVKDKDVDYIKLAQTIKIAIRALDNSVDVNFYPIEEAAKSHLKYRPLGLGVMGWTDLLHELKIDFESEEAEELASRLQEFIAYISINESINLAKERGKYPGYEDSLWSKGKLIHDTYKDLMEYMGEKYSLKETQDWEELKKKLKKHGMRNGNLMAIAPTATISQICGCSTSIEPDFSNLFVYSTMSGEAVNINEYLVKELKELGLWNKDMADKIYAEDGDIQKNKEIPKEIRNRFKTAFQVSQERLIDIAAARQIWIDQGQSLNIFFDKKSLAALNNIYMYAWKKGLKSTYYLRTRGASKVEKSVASEPKACKIDDPTCESCQ